MSNLQQAFQAGKALIPFLTAGDPSLSITEALIPEMAEAGADLIILGIPFSDPVAECNAIQAADERALTAGTTTEKIFEMVARIREKTKVPLVFMTYMNPVYVYGVDLFVAKMASCGVDALLVPDVPYEEKAELSPSCKKYGVDLISMITPTSGDRIEMIAREAEGFLYCIPSLGEPADLEEILSKVKCITDLPCAVEGTEHAIVKLIAEYGENCILPVCTYIRKEKKKDSDIHFCTY